MSSENRILNLDTLLSHGNVEGRKLVTEILEAGFRATDPYHNIRKMLRIVEDKLIVGCREFEPAGDPRSGDREYDLSSNADVYVVGAAKGVQRAAKAFEDVLGKRLTGGHVIAKKGDQMICEKIGVTFGAHPVPDEDCVIGSRQIYEIAEKAGKDDLVFTISGNGGSSLLTLPLPGVAIEDVKEVVHGMQIKRGVPTEELNAVRNHLDMLKGGRLSRHIHPAKMVHVLMWDAQDPLPSKSGVREVSDTPGYRRLMKENLWLHSLPDWTTFDDAIRILKKWGMWDEIPVSIRTHLESASPLHESPNLDDFDEYDFRVFGVLPRKGPIAAAREKGEELGIKTVVLAEWLEAEAREAGKVVAQVAKNIELHNSPISPPCVLLTTGELLVTVGDKNGVGGRNQEFILSSAVEIQGSKRIVMAAVDTDGTDGPGNQFSDDTGSSGSNVSQQCLAGGIVDGQTVDRAKEEGYDIGRELERHNSTVVLTGTGDGLLTEQGASLGDLGVVLVLGKTGMKKNSEQRG